MLYNNDTSAAVYAMERMRLGEPDEPEAVYCPECGEEANELVTTLDGEVLGCDRCTRIRSAYEWL